MKKNLIGVLIQFFSGLALINLVFYYDLLNSELPFFEWLSFMILMVVISYNMFIFGSGVLWRDDWK